ncbi:hypothetical protein [Oceanibaculum pacificum]|uniref:hypothetical protein n=1 Tax=Oceanibaculum pacificum TaxID=580166 RepID=UPI0012EE1E2D|nr:hypothetical protein [Oceanibaculum pacificum]
MLQPLAAPPPPVNASPTVVPPRPAELRGEQVQVIRDAVPNTKQTAEKPRQDERARENEQQNGGRLFDASGSYVARSNRGSQLDVTV